MCLSAAFHVSKRSRFRRDPADSLGGVSVDDLPAVCRSSIRDAPVVLINVTFAACSWAAGGFRSRTAIRAGSDPAILPPVV